MEHGFIKYTHAQEEQRGGGIFYQSEVVYLILSQMMTLSDADLPGEPQFQELKGQVDEPH
jgi:hypothetical protein